MYTHECDAEWMSKSVLDLKAKKTLKKTTLFGWSMSTGCLYLTGGKCNCKNVKS